MQLTFFKLYWQPLTVIVAAVILLWAILGGVSSGQALAQAQTTLNNARAFKQSLELFYQDQDRFPTASEFADQNIMGRYLRNFPAQNFATPLCPQSFSYKRPAPNSFELNFCLPAAVGQFSAGWNQAAEQK